MGSFAVSFCISPPHTSPTTRSGQGLVLISAGFDAARGDPLGECDVTPAGYAFLTRRLSAVANGKLVLALEGGYNTDSVKYSVSACVQVCFFFSLRPSHDSLPFPCFPPPLSKIAPYAQALLGRDVASADETDGGFGPPSNDAAACINKTIAAHAPFWACFQ